MNPLRAVFALSCALGLVGCGVDGDPSAPIDPGRAPSTANGGMSSMVATMAPGSMQPTSGPSTPAPDGSTAPTPDAGATAPATEPAARFVGRWVAVSGTHTAQCDDDPAESSDLIPYSRRVVRDFDGALSFAGSCPTAIKLDLAGDTATARANQGCTGYLSGTDIRVEVSILNSVMSTSDGQLMTFTHQETRTAGNSTGTVVCRISQEGVLVRGQ